jgi:hypothetical protein
VLGAGGITATQSHALQVGAQIIDQGPHGGGVVLEIGRTRVQLGVQNGHGAS